MGRWGEELSIGVGASVRILAFFAGEVAPNAVGMEDLAGAERGLVIHGFAASDPVAEIEPGDVELPREVDLVEGAERPEAAFAVDGVEEEVDAAEGQGADVADADGQELAGAVAVAHLDRLHGGVVQEQLEARAVLRGGGIVPAGEVALVEVELLVRRDGMVRCHGEVAVPALGTALGLRGGKAIDGNANLHAGPA